ncbi:c-type cytochrome [Myxococcus stipitatus]|uniref:c-type cytochrome n=1 Tax=Myxococcus stipitatus TaxID=83455 RepID=UPI0030D55CBD
MRVGGRNWGRCVSVALLLSLGACRQREEPPKAAAPAPAPVQPAAAPTPPVERAAGDAALVERGRYLAESVLGCVGCHTARDYSRYGGPLSGPMLAGACYGEEWEMPGTLCAPNITSDPEHGVGRWTDTELLRTLREGYGRDGRTLFPMMPYMEWRTLSDGDARAVVAWLRTVPAVAKATPPSSLPAEVTADIKDLAAPLPGPVPEPGSDPVARGAYLAALAQCAFCHTSGDDPPKPFAGGRTAPTPYGGERVPSLLPDGPVMKGLSEDAFIARFAVFKDLGHAPSRKGQLNKLAMPWASLATMKDADLRAVYRYLRTQGGPPSEAPRRASGP